MRSADTTLTAAAVQLRVVRAASADERLQMAIAMSDDARQTAIDGIMARHPSYDRATATRALVRIVYGDDLARRAWPTLPLATP